MPPGCSDFRRVEDEREGLMVRLDEDGCLAIPTGRGLGVEFDPSALERVSRA